MLIVRIGFNKEVDATRRISMRFPKQLTALIVLETEVTLSLESRPLGNRRRIRIVESIFGKTIYYRIIIDYIVRGNNDIINQDIPDNSSKNLK